MTEAKRRLVSLVAMAVVPLFFMPSCTNRSGLLGQWREIGKTATIEFHEDGTFVAVDEMGMAVTGKYELSGRGKIRFEIAHRESSTENIEAKLLMQHDELTISFEKDGGIERYRKVNSSR